MILLKSFSVTQVDQSIGQIDVDPALTLKNTIFKSFSATLIDLGISMMSNPPETLRNTLFKSFAASYGSTGDVYVFPVVVEEVGRIIRKK